MRLLLLLVVVSICVGAAAQADCGQCPKHLCCTDSQGITHCQRVCVDAFQANRKKGEEKRSGPVKKGLLEIAAGCFPGDAVVYVSTGKSKLMSELEIGDKVAVYNGKELTFEEIYAFGRKTSEPFTEFVELVAVGTDGGSTTLELTSKHFVPTIDHSGSVQHKRAEDVQVGDTVLAMNASLSKPFPHVITSKSMVDKSGRYRPYTLSGTIIVNNVMASSHSEWFLDGIFDALGVPHIIPAAYQAVLSPVRALFYILGKDTYAHVYNFLDRNLDVAAFGTKYGGTIAVGAGIASILGLYKASCKIKA